MISCCVTSDCLLLQGGELEDVPKKGAEQISEMAEAQSKKKKGGRYCVAGGPGKTSCKNTSYSAGIKMQQFPLDPRVKKKWIKFLQRHLPTFKDPFALLFALCTPKTRVITGLSLVTTGIA